MAVLGEGVPAQMLRPVPPPDRVEGRLGPRELMMAHQRNRRQGCSTTSSLSPMEWRRSGAFPGASMTAMRQRFLGIGVEDNSVPIYPDLADSASLFLTANAGKAIDDRNLSPIRPGQVSSVAAGPRH
jgi:hypothetical protein